MKAIHLRLAAIGLRVAGRYGFALAGGYAVQAHGILDRPSEDIDLFTAWERRGEFAVAVDAVVDAYRVDGYMVEVVQRFDRRALAELFAMLERYPDRRFAAYGADPRHIAALRERFAQWREELLAGED